MKSRIGKFLLLAWALPALAGCAADRYAEAFGGASEKDKAAGKVPIEAPQPEYPSLARRGGVEGCVTIAFDVTPGGHTDNFQVLDSRPKGVFDHAMLLALKDWRYPPREKPVRLVNKTQFALGDAYEGPACLDKSEVPEEMLRPGESPPEDGKPTEVRNAFPDYPKRAVKRGIEQGCVTVALDVLKDGTTANIRVLDSEPAGVFDRAVVDAAKDLKFARRTNVIRVARTFELRLTEEGRRPEAMEVSCVEADAVPDRYLRSGSDQPPPPDKW